MHKVSLTGQALIFSISSLARSDARSERSMSYKALLPSRGGLGIRWRGGVDGVWLKHG